MNGKTTLVMLMAAAAVVLAALVGPSLVRTTDEAKLARGKVFPDFNTKEAFRMELRKGDEHVICVKRNGEWEVLQPLEDKADPGSVEGLLSAFEFMRYTTRYDNTSDLKQFGLDNPQIQVTAEDPHGEVTLLVGRVADAIGIKENPDAKQVYVKVSGQKPVYCIDGEIMKDFDQTVADFRSKEAFDLPSHRITSFRLKNPLGIVSIAYRDGKWMINEPIEYPADGQEVSQLLGKICGTRKIDFVAENVQDLAPYALDNPAIALRCVTVDDQTKTLLVGKMVEDSDIQAKVYACLQGENDVFTISAQVVDALAPKLDDFRSKKILDLKPDQIVEFRREGNQPLALKDDDIFWQMHQPKQAVGDGKAVAELAKLIDSAKIYDWIDRPQSLKEFGLDQPAIISFVEKKPNAGTTEEEKLFVGATKDGKCFIKIPDVASVLVVDAAIADQARQNYLAFLGKRMLEFSKWNATNLEVSPADGIHFSAKKTGRDAWELTQPVKGSPDLSNLNKILWDMSSFDALEIVAEKGDPAKYGLAKPELKATVTVQKDENAKKYSVLFGDRIGDARFAKVEGKDTIFTVSEGMYRHFRNNLLSLYVAQIDPAAVTSVAVKLGNQVFIAQRKSPDDAWSTVKPEGGRPNVAAINLILDQMQALRAVAFASYQGGDLAQYGLDSSNTAVAIKTGDEETVVFLGKQAGDAQAAFARIEGRAPVFILDQNAQRKLFRPIRELLLSEKAGDGAVSSQQK